MASVWGTPYIIFPVGHFDYTWFGNVQPGHYSLYKIETFFEKHKDKFKKNMNKFSFKELIDSIYPVDDYLVNPICGGNEVMVTGEKYLALHMETYKDQLDSYFDNKKRKFKSTRKK